MSPGRQYLLTLATLAAAGVVGLTAASRTWGTAQLPSSSLSTVNATTVSGSDLVPLAPAASLVAMAAVVAVPAVRRVGRRVIGAVVAALGGVLMVTAAMAVRDLEGRIESWVTSSPGMPASVEDVSISPVWAFVQAGAGAMVLVAGLLVAVQGPSWPGMGSKYERRPAGDAAPSGNREAWDALDRGDDPT